MTMTATATGASRGNRGATSPEGPRAFRVAFHPKGRAHGATMEQVKAILLHGITDPKAATAFERDWKLYKAMYIPDAADKDFDLVSFWANSGDRMPFLAPLVRAWIAFPATSCEVERSFRALNEVFTRDRLAMGDETL